MVAKPGRTQFEHAEPILRVADMTRSISYYTEVLGFRNADWGTDSFTSVSRDGASIYLCRGSQGQPGTWAWVGEYRTAGARIRHPPRNYPWALEIHVDDLDGHVLRFGSEPLGNRPFDEWRD